VVTVPQAVSPAATKPQIRNRPARHAGVVNAVAPGHQRYRLRGGDRHGFATRWRPDRRGKVRVGTSVVLVAGGEWPTITACARQPGHDGNRSRPAKILDAAGITSIRRCHRSLNGAQPARGPRSASETRHGRDGRADTYKSTSPRRRRSTRFRHRHGSGRVNETGFIPTSDLPNQRAALLAERRAIDATNAVSSAPSTFARFTTSLAIDLSRVIQSICAPSATVTAWRRRRPSSR